MAPDRGWQKNTILNLALRHCRGDYLIFLDGDTIPRRDFVESHLNNARKKTFYLVQALKCQNKSINLLPIQITNMVRPFRSCMARGT